MIYHTGDDGLSSTHVAVFCFHFTPKNHISCSFFARKKRNITIIMKIIIVSKNISAVMGTWFLANHMFAK